MSINKTVYKYKREGRIIAFQALFAYDFHEIPIDDIIKFDWLEKELDETALEYAKFLISGTIENIKTIDDIIKSKLRNWDFERISSIDKAILRFSIFSIMHEKELPEKIIINEAIEIVKEFGSDESYKFVNGILDAIRKSKESE
jgi:transcription antitermination protein NusB